MRELVRLQRFRNIFIERIVKSNDFNLFGIFIRWIIALRVSEWTSECVCCTRERG